VCAPTCFSIGKKWRRHLQGGQGQGSGRVGGQEETDAKELSHTDT